MDEVENSCIMVSYRKATEEDRKEIFTLGNSIEELKLNGKWIDEKDLHWCIKSSIGEFWIAESNEKIIGFIYFNKEFFTSACLVYIAIMPQFKNHRIGESLFNYAYHNLVKDKYIKSIYSLSTNATSSAFLEKMGFSQGIPLSYHERNTIEQQMLEKVE